jgi:small subunit ribosomal protein S1
MVDRNIVKKVGLTEEELEKQVNELFTSEDSEYLESILQKKVDSRQPGTIVEGVIDSQFGNDVIVEIGLKSEGVVDSSEFDDPDEIEPGKTIDVLLEDADTEGGLIPLSKRKADRIKGWENIITTKQEGDVVTGNVIRRIKGGLLIDIGVPVFLPASQVDIRKPGDISRFIGKDVTCKILKIDEEGRNIVVSRRKLIEEERSVNKDKILEDIEVGQKRKGVVKNIADFGVFVDLGGVDGLLHISDLSWGRISHPSEVVELDEEIECMVIDVDKENEKISLGLKQKTESPWKNVEERYPVGSKVTGKVVNVMNYGVFIRLEDGIEGLVHISEMSWTKRLSHPSEMLNLGDEIEVVVLSVNKEKQEISLGLKQTETNPWEVAAQKYPPGTVVEAVVRSMTNFGAFVEIEQGIDGMIHISDLSWTQKYNHPSEALDKGQKVKCVVLDIDPEKQRMSLGLKQLTEDPWEKAIPSKYIPGHIIQGKVSKITNFGAFVELEPQLEGLLHISELADHKVDKPQDIVKEGQEVEVKILKVDSDSRKIGLSLRRAQWAAEENEDDKDSKAKKKDDKPDHSIGVETVLSNDHFEKFHADSAENSEQQADDSAQNDEQQTNSTEENSQPDDSDEQENKEKE